MIERSLGRIIPVDAGNFDYNKQYEMFDYVRHNHATFICKRDCKGVEPVETFNNYWKIIAKDGTDGVSLGATSEKEGRTTTVSIYNDKTMEVLNSFEIQDGEGGDMFKTEYATNGVQGVVDIADKVTSNAVDGSSITLDSNGKIKAKELTWSNVTGKPFNSIDDNTLKVEDNVLGVKNNGKANEIPTYYREIVVSPSSVENGITIDDFQLPCKLILKNINPSTSYLEIRNLFVNGNSYMVSRQSSGYGINSITIRLYGTASTSNVRNDAELYLTTAKNGELYAFVTQLDTNTTYGGHNFLELSDYGELTNTTAITIDLEANKKYLLFVDTYTLSTGAYASAHASMIISNTSTIVALGTNGTQRHSEAVSNGVLTLKTTGSTYGARYSLYQLYND